LGDIAKACEFFEESIQIWDQDGRNYFDHIKLTHLALGRGLRNLDKFQDSKQVYTQLISLADSLTYARLNYGIAAIYAEREMLDSTKFFVEEGKNIMREGDKRFLQEAEQLLAEIALQQRDTAQALAYFNKAQDLRLNDRNAHLYIIPTVINYHLMANLFSNLKDYSQALENCQEGLKLLTIDKVGLEDWKKNPSAASIIYPFEAIDLLKSKAAALFELYKSNEDSSLLKLAYATAKLGIDLIPKIQKLHVSEGGKLYLSKEARPLIELGIEIAQGLYKLENAKEYLWNALSFAETIKARILTEELLETEALFESQIPEKDLLEFENLKADINFYTKRLESFEPKNEKDSIKLNKWEDLLSEKESRLVDLEKSWEKKYPLYQHKKLSFPELNPPLFQNYLAEDAGLLEFFWGERKLHLFLIQSGDISHFDVKLQGLDDELESIAKFLRQVDMSPAALTSFQKISQGLYARLLSKVLEGNKMKSLYLVADGPLSYLPFEILLSSRKELAATEISSSQSYRLLPYLFKKYDIRYVYSAGLLGLGLQNKGEAKEELASFAPEYEGLLSLENNVRSAQEIAHLLNAKAYIKEEASEDVFQREAKNYHSLYLAMHGNANVEKPVNAYLDFGQSPHRLNDGKLYVHELYAQSLNAQLVSMIACDAGYGKLESGEGVMSLARAFRIAGVDNIMTSLWKADGRAAMPIAKSFYEHLIEGEIPSTSLQKAKLKFLEEASPDMTHPYFWATYVVMGNNQRIWRPAWQKYALWLLGISVLLTLLLLGRKYLMNT
ncbi:MAG: CHAT domain-containing protein, partial [Bacteroidota bacterium]